MTTFKSDKSDILKVKKGTNEIPIIKKVKFDSFNENILGLGKIETKSTQLNALSAFFDLEGFTNFCKQIDPQLAVPEFLSEFLQWLFRKVKLELIEEEFPEGYKTYSELPLLSKFMGDGVLFLWDVDSLDETQILNIVVSMNNICVFYAKEFYKNICSKIISPPKNLRCGIARGAIYSVGNGNDFVGPCINMSARLQKLNSLSFCFSRRGLNPDDNPWLKENTFTKKTEIRGIGSEELVCVLKHDFEKISEEDKKKFIKP